MNYTRFFAILGFIFLGIMSRFLPHPPNFTALNAVALFGVCSLGGLSVSLATVLSVMLASDLVLGFHSSLPSVYLSLGLVVLMGHWFDPRRSLGRILCFLVASSLLFFMVTNFATWLTTPLYSKTCLGLGFCYLAAIPFLANQVLGDLLFGFLLFQAFAFTEQRFPLIRKQN